jgi:hypothetical protein
LLLKIIYSWIIGQLHSLSLENTPSCHAPLLPLTPFQEIAAFCSLPRGRAICVCACGEGGANTPAVLLQAPNGYLLVFENRHLVELESRLGCVSVEKKVELDILLSG